ncbi:LacI family DNA-binding transcriptional regulator [Devosia sp. ZB163]|uniref:LacI family DNA-binding transcriptional regulator n=1 Tax=Devosia sp. ZB163 TaxID=3025938 RepID=UPI002362B35E|nr:LacI family DNA-binding transcriptional regulator [Devosia sp. ZB163]MDC9823167.1 LacI family DNA-binding transcriptional regulator [Devosia sp. ZB163]
MNKSVRLSDVARAAGVSLGTASNVFNRPDIVRAEVREHVERVARELGFSGPDPVGRLLMGGKANAIGVLPAGDMSVSFTIGSPYLSALLLGVAEVCDEHGASLVVVSGAHDRKEWAIKNALVDGFVLGQTDEIAMVKGRQRAVPFAMIDVEGGPGVGSALVDGRAGARKQVVHLLALGHRRFAIMAVRRQPVEPIWHPPGQGKRALSGFPLDREKLAGYAEALGAAGIDIDAVPMVESHPPSPWAEAGAKLLLDNMGDATAVLAMSDRNAKAILEEAAKRGIRVPQDLSVIGFDDVAISASLDPPLTTIRQDTVEKGRVAARMIFGDLPMERRTIPVELVVRASTAPPRG